MRSAWRLRLPFALLALGCDSATEPADPQDADAPASVRILAPPFRPHVGLAVGQRVQLRAEVFDRNGKPIEDAQVEWLSSAPATATVDATGSLRGVARGMTRVSARAGAAMGEVPVAVELEVEAATVGFETLQFPSWSPLVADLGRSVNMGHVEFTAANARIYLWGPGGALADYAEPPLICARASNFCDTPLEVRFPRGAALLSFSMARDFRAGVAARVIVEFEDGTSRVVEARADGLPWTGDRVDLADDGRVIHSVTIYNADVPTGLMFDSFSFYALTAPAPPAS